MITANNYSETLMDVADIFVEAKATSKGIQRKSIKVNINPINKEINSLKQQFKNIPTGNDIKEDTKHTKINIMAHGGRGGRVSVTQANSGSEADKKLRFNASEYLSPLLANALAQGDYGNKLTVSLQNCYGAAQGKQGEASTMDIIADELEEKGIYGVRVTGTTSTNLIDETGSRRVLNKSDGTFEKASKSDKKMDEITQSPAVLTPTAND